MANLRGICVGAGYFSQFHYDAWRRVSGVDIVAICDHDLTKAQAAAADFPTAKVYARIDQALAEHEVDFVDIITPPGSHLELVTLVASHGLDLICQKPLAPTLEQAQQIVETANAANVRMMIHDNWRFQPWYREIKQLLDQQAIGDKLHSLNFRMRMGDGWGEDAYLGRQPYFREMERLLIFETGVHFIDAFRYVAGEIDGVYATTRRLNHVIKGEDAATVLFEFESGALGSWDANRFNESNDENPRYTFGDFVVEGNGGTIRLASDGRLSIQPLGQSETDHPYVHSNHGFCGDCVFATINHFIDCLTDGDEFETNGPSYLRTLEVQEAVYVSAATRSPVRGLLAKQSS